MLYRSLMVALVALSGCMTTAQQPRPSMADAMMVTHYDMLHTAESQRELMRQRLRPGLTQAQVIQTVASISQEVNGWHDEGQPDSQGFEVVGGVTVETWKYACYDRDIMLTFQNGVLTGMSELQGRTVLG